MQSVSNCREPRGNAVFCITRLTMLSELCQRVIQKKTTGRMFWGVSCMINMARTGGGEREGVREKGWMDRGMDEGSREGRRERIEYERKMD